MARSIQGLIWAGPTEVGPFGVQKRRKGAKAAGLRYEKLVRKALPAAARWSFNPWFEFVDANGKGFAQPDFVLRTKNEVLVVECKLTFTEEAFGQLQELYFPILHYVHRLPVRGIVLTKNLTPSAPPPTPSFRAAVAASRKGQIPVVHWLGHSSLD